jgi:peptidyl-prolyl cis-trans isomerase A (cyclophilin A)
MLGRYFAHCRITLIIALVLTGTLTVSRAVRAQDLADTPKVIFSTTLGNFMFELYPGKAPITVKNFLAYVDAGYFDNTVFHRVIPGFMIQGGGFTEQMQKKPTNPPIKNEAKNGLKNKRGTLSMARTQVVDSATAQFFLNLKDNAFLDHGTRDYGYAVFARVIAGMEVIDMIAAVPTGSKDVPKTPVVIKSARLN